MSDSEKNDLDLPAGNPKKLKVKKNARPPRKRIDMSSGRIKLWFREMRSELKKVVWPTPKQVLNNSAIVAVAVLVVGTIIALYDWGAYLLVEAIVMSFKS